MRQATPVQQTTAPEDGGFSRRRYSMFKMKINGRKPSRSELTVLGAIFSFSNVKGKPDASCQMSYSSFEKQFRLSRATVARAIGAGLDAGIITQDKSNPAHASYKYPETAKETGFIVTEHYLYSTKFAIKGEPDPRYLTRSAIDVLSLIKTHCENEKGPGKFIGSVHGIMSTLSLSKRTVQKAIDLLLAADLIHRPTRGINSHVRSEFTVNKKLLRTVSKQYKKSVAAAQPTQRETVTASVAALDAKADRERYYAALQWKAKDRVASFQRQLDEDPKYHELDLEERKLRQPIGRFEAYGNLVEAEELKRKQKSLKVQMARRMTALGISSDDLKPVYECNRCRDTGWRIRDGRACSCYPSPGRRQS